MKFAKVFPLLIAKAEKKGRTADEVYEVTCWLTGYTKESLNELLNNDSTYGEFLDKAPRMNPDRLSVKGKICGVKVIQRVRGSWGTGFISSFALTRGTGSVCLSQRLAWTGTAAAANAETGCVTPVADGSPELEKQHGEVGHRRGASRAPV